MPSDAAPRGAGVLMAIGGAEDKLGDRTILSHFVRLAAHRRGAVVGGTSAGASALSSHMVAFGGPGEVPKQRLAHMAAGLGLLPGAVIDQHFTQRNRLGRLLLLVAESPSQLGIGIDEDTAAVVTPDGVLEVLGKGTVTVVDGARAQSDAFEVRARRPVLVSGVVLHALPPGYRFDLGARVLLPRLQSIPVAGRRGRAGPRPRRRAGGEEEQEASQ